MSTLHSRLSSRIAILRGFDARRVLDYDFRLGAGNDIANASRRGLRYSSTPTITYTGGDNGTYFDQNGVLQTSGTDIPRFDHNPVTGAPLGLLIEEARENLGLGSEDASDNSNELRVTVSTNTAVAPDGNTTMDSLLETADTNTHQLNLDILTVSSSTLYTITYSFKKLNNDYVELSWIENGVSSLTPHIVFRFSTEAVVASSGITSSFIQNIGNGIYRIGFSATTESDTTGMLPIILTNTDGSSQQSYAGNTSNGVYLWGKQIEAGAFPSSSIKTVGAAVTRSADVATIALSDVPGFNQSAGTILIEAVIPSINAASGQALVVIDDGGLTDRIRINQTASADTVQIATTNSSGNNGSSQLTGIVAGTAFKIAGAYAQDDVVVAFDGTLGTADTTTDLPTTDALTTLRIGRDSAGDATNGHIARLVYWNVRQTDEFLQDVTA